MLQIKHTGKHNAVVGLRLVEFEIVPSDWTAAKVSACDVTLSCGVYYGTQCAYYGVSEGTN